MGEKINVLFTGAGGSGTIYILKSLKKYRRYRTTAVDMNPYAVGLYVADRGYKVPPVTDSRYLDVISEIIKKEKVNIVVPLIDEELLKILDLKEKILGLEVLLPERDFVEMTLDKLKTAAEFKKANIPVPETCPLNKFSYSKESFPMIIKPRHGRGSRGFRHLHSLDDLYDYLNTEKYDRDELILQRPIAGKEFTVSATVTKNGDVLSVVPKEVILKVGITKVGVTRDNPSIINLCKKIQEKFKANGPFNVQLIVEKESQILYVIEVNPRFSTTVVLTMASGIDEVDLLIRDRLNLKVPKMKPFKENLIMMRYEDEIFIDENDLVREHI